MYVGVDHDGGPRPGKLGVPTGPENRGDVVLDGDVSERDRKPQTQESSTLEK